MFRLIARDKNHHLNLKQSSNKYFVEWQMGFLISDLTTPSPITGLKRADCQAEDSPKRRYCRKSAAGKQVPVYAEVFCGRFDY